MPGFKEGDKVRVKVRPSSPLYGKVGVVLRSSVYGLAITYEVTFDQFVTHFSPANRFFEYDLELAGS